MYFLQYTISPVHLFICIYLFAAVPRLEPPPFSTDICQYIYIMYMCMYVFHAIHYIACTSIYLRSCRGCCRPAGVGRGRYTIGRRTHAYSCMHIYIYIYVYICIYVCVYIYIYICVCVCVCVGLRVNSRSIAVGSSVQKFGWALGILLRYVWTWVCIYKCA